MINILIDESVKQRLSGFKVAYNIFDAVAVKERDEELINDLKEEQSKIRKRFNAESIREEAGLRESRRAFKALGLDPARYRPSQEALLRRIIKGEDLYLINSGVDVCNLLSVRYRLPMGLYDADKISGDLILKVGNKDDVYLALNGREVVCDDKLILCDHQGVIGSPYVDSQRTAVELKTKRFLHVLYFVYQTFDPALFNEIQETILKYHGGKAVHYFLQPFTH